MTPARVAKPTACIMRQAAPATFAVAVGRPVPAPPAPAAGVA